MVYANGKQLMSPWPCPPDNRVRDFNGLANPLPCLSARGHAFTRCTEVRIGSEGAGQGGVTAVRAPLWGAQSEDCIRSFGPLSRREGGDAQGGDLSGVVTYRYAPCAKPSVRWYPRISRLSYAAYYEYEFFNCNCSHRNMFSTNIQLLEQI